MISLLVFTGLYWFGKVLLVFTGFYWFEIILLVFTGLSREVG
jgi:hypothetical protein